MKKRTVSIILSALMLLTVGFQGKIMAAESGHNYVDVLAKSILFYEASWCGEDAGNNRISWRGPCHTEDGADIGLDLTGGFHDAGDHVKFGLPQGYSASVLNWTLNEYEDVLKDKGQYDYLYNICKHFTDYFIKCHPDSNTFYYQVGDGDTDHAYWGPPELQKTSRPSYAAATPSTPASEMCGEASAALAMMSMNAKQSDPSYSDKCLDTAKSIYTLGKTYKGRGTGQSYYTSGPYWDELAWAGIWMYRATGDNNYLNDVDDFIRAHLGANGAQGYQNNWTMCWDDVWAPVFLELYEITGDTVYKECVEYNLNYWMNNIRTTPGGLKYLNNWGVLRYAAAESAIALLYYEMSNDDKYLEFAKSQINYMLGDNPRNSSYVVGYGNNYPKFPHHRAASGRLEGPPADEKKQMPERHILYGALVGGPDSCDNYDDDVEAYVHTEVALDYNAGFVCAMAGMAKYLGQGQVPEEIPEENPTDALYVMAKLSKDTPSEIKLDTFIYNESVNPPAYKTNMSYKYFLDLSEVYNNGYTASDISVVSYYNPNHASISSLKPWDEENHIYYVEIDWGNVEIYGKSEFQLVLTGYAVNCLSGSNDWSQQGLNNTLQKTKYIPVYVDGIQVYGIEPDGNTNTAPVANDDTAETTEGIAVVIDVLDNDYDEDGVLEVFSVKITEEPSNGRIYVDSLTGKVKYTPEDGFIGEDSFKYTVRDDYGDESNEATVVITVEGEQSNKKPVANDDTAETTEGTAVVIDVLDNDYDEDGVLEIFSVNVTEAASNGRIYVDSLTGKVTYTPDEGFVGEDSFKYTVRDNYGEESNEATVVITVKKEENEVDYKVNFGVISDWRSGFSGKIVIINTGDTPLRNWELEFDFDRDIDAFWTARILSHNGSHYIISGYDWNSTIMPGKSVELEFNGRPGEVDEGPTNYELHYVEN